MNEQDEWIVEWMDGRVDIQVDDIWVSGWIGGWIDDIWVSRQTDRNVGGWVNVGWMSVMSGWWMGVSR